VAGTLLADELARHPGHPKLLRARVLWFANRKEYEPLLTLLTDFQPTKVEDLSVALTAAAVLRAAGPPYTARALELYEHVVAIAPELTEAQLGLAALASQTHDAARAERIYRQLLDREPGNAEVLNDCAWVLTTALGRHEEALDLATRGVRLAPRNPHVRDTLATVLQNLGRLGEARAELEKCAELLADDPGEHLRATLRLARISAQLPDPASARRYLDEAAALEERAHVLTVAERQELDALRRAASN
jgi:Tfp pilus assembly protein PilF